MIFKFSKKNMKKLRRRWKIARFLVLLLATFNLLLPTTAGTFTTSHSPSKHGKIEVRTGPVIAVKLDSSINPATYGLLKRGLKESQREKASLFIIVLDTPGGLVTSVRKMVQLIMTSQIPVAVFVYPPGARAASAGAILTLAADIAAMAPGTNIGAAHPVGLGGDIEENSTMASKIENDLAALAVSIATKRGRNAKWAEKAVRKSLSSPAQEALKLHVIDIIADNVSDLILKLRGKIITLANGNKVIVEPKDPTPIFIKKGWGEKVLEVIADPNVAYILMMIGMVGLYFELAHPGVIFPGTVGALCLLFSLYALHTLSASTTAILFILLAFLLFVLELFITSHGILALSGTVALIMGSLMLFGSDSAISISASVLWPTLIIVSLFFLLIAFIAAKATLSRPKTGLEALVGSTGTIKEVLGPGKYLVFAHGELWRALGPKNLAKGQHVEIIGIKGLKLKIRSMEE